MNLTIYVLGDVPVFQSMLNAVAMVFQSGMLSGPGLGLGAAVGLGLLISLVMVLINGLFGKWSDLQKSPAILIVLVITFVGLVGVKTSVLIEDIYTGNTTAVDNVPLGVAVPGAVVSGITKRISEHMATAFSTKDGNYINMTTSGFVQPLAMLNALRGYKTSGNGNGTAKGVLASGHSDMAYLDPSLRMFMLDCVVVTASSFNAADFRKSRNVINYITSNYAGGLTVEFNAANPDGIGVDCATAATHIQTRMAAYISDDTAAGLAGLVNLNMGIKKPDGTPYDASGDAASTVNALFGAATNAHDFMMNALTIESLTDTLDCATMGASGASLMSCQAMLVQGKEQMRVDMAGGGALFRSIMTTGMNVLHAMFYGFSPLVFIFGIMMAERGLGIIIKYMLFGIWCQTWLPFAVVINYFMQLKFRAEVEAAKIQGVDFTPQTYWTTYQSVADSISFGADMLAMTPVISLALLTGSVYTLTSMAQRWTGKDYLNEKIIAPDVQSPASVASMHSRYMQQGDGYSKESRIEEAGLKVGASIKNDLSNTEAERVQKQSAVSDAASKGWSEMRRSGETAQHMDQFVNSSSLKESDAYQALYAKGKSIAQGKGMSDEVADQFSKAYALEMGLGFGGKGGGGDGKAAEGVLNKVLSSLSPVHFSAGMQDQWKKTYGAKAVSDIKSSMNDQATIQNSKAVSTEVGKTASNATAFTKAFGHELGEQNTRAIQASASELHSTESAYQSMKTISDGAGRDAVMTGGEQNRALTDSQWGEANRQGVLALGDRVAGASGGGYQKYLSQAEANRSRYKNFSSLTGDAALAANHVAAIGMAFAAGEKWAPSAYYEMVSGMRGEFASRSYGGIRGPDMNAVKGVDPGVAATAVQGGNAAMVAATAAASVDGKIAAGHGAANQNALAGASGARGKVDLQHQEDLVTEGKEEVKAAAFQANHMRGTSDQSAASGMGVLPGVGSDDAVKTYYRK